MSVKVLLIFSLLAVLAWNMPVNASDAQPPDAVILLHGLARSSKSMLTMEKALRSSGFSVTNINYSSRNGTIEEISEHVVGKAIEAYRNEGFVKIHFVTHSMGGILVRYYFSRHSTSELGKVVMLGPPNQGSEVVDFLGSFHLFKWINGVAGTQLGTSSNSVPRQLGPAPFDAGIIAGNRSINWINSLLIPGRDDGKVSLESAKLDGMQDYIVLPVSHPFIMKNKESIKQTIHFLQTGSFIRPVTRR